MVVILLLNVMEVMRVGGGALLDRPRMVFQIMCVCCACDPSVHLDVPSICFVYVVYVRSNLLIWEIKSWCLIPSGCFLV